MTIDGIGSNGNRVNPTQKESLGNVSNVEAKVDQRADLPLASGDPLPGDNQVDVPPMDPPALHDAGSGRDIDTGAAREALQKMGGEELVALFDRFAELAIQFGIKQARIARTEKIAQDQERQAQLNKAAHDMEKGAALALTGSVLSGAMQVASAGISIAGGVKTLSLTTGTGGTANVMLQSSQAQGVQMKYQGVAQSIGAGSQIASGSFNFGEKMEQAESKRDEAEAERTRSFADENQTYASKQEQTLSKLMQALDDVESGKQRTLTDISRQA